MHAVAFGKHCLIRWLTLNRIAQFGLLPGITLASPDVLVYVVRKVTVWDLGVTITWRGLDAGRDFCTSWLLVEAYVLEAAEPRYQNTHSPRMLIFSVFRCQLAFADVGRCCMEACERRV